MTNQLTMKYNYLFFSLLILVQLSSCIAEPVKWINYKSEKFDFKIEFPKTPFEKTQTLDVEGGQLKLNIIGADCQKDLESYNVGYMVNCTEYPESFFDGFTKETYETFFYNSIKGMVNNQITDDGHLSESQVLDLQGCQGREVKIVFNKGQDINTARFILNGHKLYILFVTSHIRKYPNPDIQKFFDSFELLSNPRLENTTQIDQNIEVSNNLNKKTNIESRLSNQEWISDKGSYNSEGVKIVYQFNHPENWQNIAELSKNIVLYRPEENVNFSINIIAQSETDLTTNDKIFILDKGILENQLTTQKAPMGGDYKMKSFGYFYINGIDGIKYISTIKYSNFYEYTVDYRIIYRNSVITFRGSVAETNETSTDSLFNIYIETFDKIVKSYKTLPIISSKNIAYYDIQNWDSGLTSTYNSTENPNKLGIDFEMKYLNDWNLNEADSSHFVLKFLKEMNQYNLECRLLVTRGNASVSTSANEDYLIKRFYQKDDGFKGLSTHSERTINGKRISPWEFKWIRPIGLITKGEYPAMYVYVADIQDDKYSIEVSLAVMGNQDNPELKSVFTDYNNIFNRITNSLEIHD